MPPKLTCALLLALLLAPAAAAGSADDPEVTDPAGDAGPDGGPTPPGFGWADVTAAWIQDETPDSFTVKLAVTDGTVPPRGGSGVGLVFEFADTGWLVGYAHVTIPTAPPIIEEGGWVCAWRDATPTECEAWPDATFEGGVYTIPAVHRHLFGAEAPGSRLERVHAVSGIVTGEDGFMRFDDTATGRDYAFAGNTPPPGGPAAAPNATTEPDPAEAAARPADPQEAPPEARPTPGTGALTAALAAAAATLGRRRK